MNATFLGAVFAFLAVALGAFGAHALRSRLDPQMLSVFETGVRYQFLHTLALLVTGRRGGEAPRPGADWAASLFTVGILLFSGSLYGLALSGVPAWGAVTPFGGACFLAGWLVLAWSSWRR